MKKAHLLATGGPESSIDKRSDHTLSNIDPPLGLQRPPPTLDVLIARCQARAALYAAGELDLIEAVDPLQADAEAAGLVAAVGQDTIQGVMADAFLAVRQELHSEPAQESRMACSTCGCDPCANPDFCRACRQADAR